jgi:hypothetical protein
MKSTLLFSAIFIAASTFAQSDAYKLVIGGTLAYSHQSYSTYNPIAADYQDVTSGRTTFSTYIGYRFFNEGMIGLQGSIGLVKEEVFFPGITDKIVHDGHEFGFGGFARKYFKLHEDFRLFLEGGALYLKGSNKSSNEQVAFGPAKSYHSFKAYLSPGFTWSITKRLNLVAMFGQVAYVKGKRVGLFETQETPFSYFDFRLRGNGLRLGAELKI